MITVKAESTFGNFKWFGHAELTEAQAEICQNLGFLWIMQRTPSSDAEKALAGYEKRPKEFKRASIDFSQERADELKALMTRKVEIAEDVKIETICDKVEFHEIGAGTLPKFVEEIKIADRHVKAGDFAQWMVDTVDAKFTVADYENEDKRTDVLLAIKALVARLRANV